MATTVGATGQAQQWHPQGSTSWGRGLSLAGGQGSGLWFQEDEGTPADFISLHQLSEEGTVAGSTQLSAVSKVPRTSQGSTRGPE